jgi:hypothetical protein
MKSLLGLLLVASLIVNARLIFSSVDSSVSLEHSRSQNRFLKAREKETLVILNSVFLGKSVQNLDASITAAKSADLIVKEYDDVIEIGDLSFVVENSVVSNIKFF